MAHRGTDVAVIGGGIIGISAAYYLKQAAPELEVALIEAEQPMAFTSAQSGENYRNWWPHPVMKDFTDRSIDLMEVISRESENRINLTRRGYLLATRQSDIQGIIQELSDGYGASDDAHIRVHTDANTYVPAELADWQTAPDGVDVLCGHEFIQSLFPCYADDIATVIHIRRAGTVDSQQLGQFMLEKYKECGGVYIQARVAKLETSSAFSLELVPRSDAPLTIMAEQVINAAGPFINELSAPLGLSFPIQNVLQQKVAFEDTLGAIPRQLPFSVDLDAQTIDWGADERELLATDPDFSWLTKEMTGAIHCRPDGGDRGKWIKLGWAYNTQPGTPVQEPTFDDYFPDVVVRGASRLHPTLKPYIGRLPRNRRHYGGYYCMTEENWPLIGATSVPGFFVVGAMSGFGTMAACVAGELVAGTLLGTTLPAWANDLSMARYEDAALMTVLKEQNSKGVL